MVDKLNIFAKTEPGAGPATDSSDLDSGNVRPLGVGLRAGEVAALDQIANQYGVARNALLRFAVRYFILQFRAGKVDISGQVEAPPPPKKRLKFPK